MTLFTVIALETAAVCSYEATQTLCIHLVTPTCVCVCMHEQSFTICQFVHQSVCPSQDTEKCFKKKVR